MSSSNNSKIMSLGELLESSEVFVDGDWIESKDQDPNGGVRLIQLADIGVNHFIDKSSRYLTHEKANELKCTFLKKGDLLIARMPDPIGRCCIFPGIVGTAVTVVDVCIIRPDLKKIHPEWLMHCINSEKFQNDVASWVTGTTRQRISRGNLSKISINLPTLPEQRRIAAILDKAEALRSKRREAIAKLDQLLQSVFLEMFGDPVTNPKKWPIVPIENLAKLLRDGPFGSNLKSEHYVKTGVRVVRLQNIGVWDFSDRDKAYISEDHFSKLPRNHCFPGDVLVGTLGEPNLRACIQPNHVDRALNKADCLLFRPDFNIANSEYICGLLNSESLISFSSSLSLGQTRLRISMGRLKELSVPQPPLEIQNNFRDFYLKFSEEKKQLENSSIDIEKLKSSITTTFFQ